MPTPQHRLELGAQFPYDASDDAVRTPPPATDWAHTAARGVIADLQDRRGIKHAFDNLDEDVRKEITGDMAAIIRAASLEQATRLREKLKEIYREVNRDGHVMKGPVMRIVGEALEMLQPPAKPEQKL